MHMQRFTLKLECKATKKSQLSHVFANYTGFMLALQFPNSLGFLKMIDSHLIYLDLVSILVSLDLSLGSGRECA